MVNMIILSSFSAIAIIGGCKQIEFHSGTLDSPQTELQKLEVSKIVFNWSDVGSSLKDNLWDQAGNAMEKNRSIKSEADLPNLGIQGSGLYVAMDPFLSTRFGVELSCISMYSGAS